MAARILGSFLLVIYASAAAALDADQPGGPPGRLFPPGVSASIAAKSGPERPAAPAEAAFEPARRAVTNWRTEALDNLDLSEETKAKLTGGPRLPDVPRCVKLNNYWCIKRARWAGEIAADTENHVAFASAIDGASAAVMLLRRYYLDYNRRSAMAILARWAPAQCAGMTPAAGRPLKPYTARLAALRRDAPLGIQNTLRARWLAAHRQGFSRPDKTKTLRRSIVRSWPMVMMQAPEIAVGMGEPQHSPKQAPIPLTQIAALDFAAPVTARPGPSCADETTRIQNYATRAIDGIAASPDEDLTLFLPDGTPGANLSRLLENMAKVEIGPLAARAGLITAAIDRLVPRSVAVETPRHE